MAEAPKRPSFDPAYKHASGFPNPTQTLDIPTLRTGMQTSGINASSIAQKHPQYQHTDLTIPGISNLSDTHITLALYQPAQPAPQGLRKWPAGRPVVYHVHGGAQIAGSRFFGLEFAMAHFSAADDIVFASPEYRLAPEHPAPAGAHDVLAGLVYLVRHAEELDIDPARIVLYGVSGGAGVAASAALLSRKMDGPRCCAFVLDSPMLDDRSEGVASAEQFWDGTMWPGWMDRSAWDAVLGDADRTDSDGVRVAGRADSLADLPLTFIDVGECESMRDQAVAFASRIWRDGGSAELHVWPGVYHGGAMFEPGVPVGQGMLSVQKGFLGRVFSLDENEGKGEEETKAVL